MTICTICQKHQKLENEYVLYMDEYWIMTHSTNGSNLLGYCYLEPRRHIENWSDFSKEELKKMGPLIKKYEQALLKEIQLERLYVVTISEAVRHLHLHLIPRERESLERGVPLISSATSPLSSKSLLEKHKIQKLVENVKNNISLL